MRSKQAWTPGMKLGCWAQRMQHFHALVIPNPSSVMKKSLRLTPLSRIFALLALLFSFNVAHANTYQFDADLTSAGEAAPSPATGHATVTIDDVAQTMRVQVTFSGLLSNVTASHIHAFTALPNIGNASVATGVPTFLGFPSGVTSGTYDNTFNLLLQATYNNPFYNANGATGATASAALLNALLSERAYLNIHSTNAPAGEIRGFLRTPDSASTAMLLMVAVGAAGLARRRLVRA